MNEASSYLRHLPPVLWENDQEQQVSLGALLRIFEKIATGIPDDVALPALTDEIAAAHRIFDPWATPVDFLPWLASWVALEFPTLQDQPLWDEYQRRKVTAEIAGIYRLRGRKTGLNRYLTLYAVGQARARVAVDDGARLLAVTPRPGAPCEVTALVTQGPVLHGGQLRAEGLIRPWAVAAADGALFVADIGLPDRPNALRAPARIWRLAASGRYPLAGTPPRPAPLAPDTANLKDPVAVAVGPQTAYVLTRAGRLFAVAAPYQGVPATLVTTLSTPGTAVWMVALSRDPVTGNLLALDRGARPPAAAAPAIVTVQLDPVKATRTRLAAVEPLALAVEPDGTLLIGDGGDQQPAGEQQFAGNLWRVDRRADPWAETRLLGAGNPLAAPTGVARTETGALYVLDAGLKPFAPSAADPFICPVAEHAAVYAVDLAAGTVVRVTAPGEFVYPTGLAAAGDHLVVADPGQPEVSGLEPYWSRVRPFQFDVSVHFTAGRLPDDEGERERVLDQAVGNISSIVTEQKPAHTLWTLTTSVL